MAWHAIMVAPQREFDVQHRLHALDMETLVPVEYRTVRLHRNTKRVTQRAFPLLTGYVIADLGRHSPMMIRSVDDVTGFVFRDGQPAILTDTELQQVREMDARPSMVPSSRRSFALGDMVRVSAGAFSGLQFRLERRDNSAAIAPLPFLGSTHPVKIPLDWLEPVH